MSERSKQFLKYLQEHQFRFTMEKALEETGMNKNILYKVIRELRKTYDFNRIDGNIIVTKKKGVPMNVNEKNTSASEPKKMQEFLSKVLALVQEKGEAGVSITESGRSVSGFRACMSLLRNLGHRIDFKDDRYYYKGLGEFSLCYTKGFPEPKKVWGKYKEQKPIVRKPVEQKPEPKTVMEIQEKSVTLAGNPFTINYDVLKHSLKGAPRNYINFVNGLVKKIQLANDAYASLVSAQIQMTNAQIQLTNVNGILSKAGD
jgi:hypothetical protein